MKALVEVVGRKAIIIMFGDTKQVANELEIRYNKEVKEAEVVDWKHTDYYDEDMYAKFSDWNKKVQWFTADVQEGA